jgi:hypothetical protein
MHQMSGSIDSTHRLLDLADEVRFPLMSHVWRLDNRDESRERRGPAPTGPPTPAATWTQKPWPRSLSKSNRPRISRPRPTVLRGLSTNLDL